MTSTLLRWSGPVLLGLLLATRAPLEASMLGHMLVQLPLLVICGALLRPWLRLPARLARWDGQGLATLTAAAFVTTYWMIPRALEQALFEPLAAVAKFASLLLLGAALPGALRRAHVVVQLFFVANICAMMAIAGMLYRELPQRLCNAYLLDDQTVTGTALVVLALVLGVAWCIVNARHFADPPERPDDPDEPDEPNEPEEPGGVISPRPWHVIPAQAGIQVRRSAVTSTSVVSACELGFPPVM